MKLPKTLLGFIWHFVKKQKMYFILIQILAFAWSTENIAWPFVLRMLIDKITTYTSEQGNIWHYLMPLLIIWSVIWLVIEIAYRVFGFMMAYVFPRFESHIVMTMFGYVQGHSYEYFSNHFAGSISNRISDMSRSVTAIIQLIMTLFAPALLAFIIASIIFYTITPWFTAILVGWAVLHIGICLAGARKCANASEIHANSRSFLIGKVVDSFTNIINIKLFARKHYECEYIYKYQKDERQKHIDSLTIAEKIKVVLAISSFLFPGLLLTWYIIYSWQNHLISLGSLVLIFNTTWNIEHLAWYAGLELPNLYREIGVCQQAMSLVRAGHDIKDKPKAKELKIQQGQIEFDKVNFNYKKGRKVFKNLTITLHAGSKVGLVGFSGSGKSTFVNLIMRFFDIESGAIKIDNIDIRDVKVESLRSQIAMIPQDPSLFHRTLRDNIRYGKIDASEEQIIAASKQAHSHEFICTLPESYDSLVGERGIKLSGGQRQRITIARAILKDAPILILDEATSALDSVTEKRIQEALHYLMKGRTTLIIAHRLSTLFEMDRILVFAEGQIIEDGTHQQLLIANGHYAKMWKMQAGGFLPDKPVGLEK